MGPCVEQGGSGTAAVTAACCYSMGTCSAFIAEGVGVDLAKVGGLNTMVCCASRLPIVAGTEPVD
jgi:hypothetical protein